MPANNEPKRYEGVENRVQLVALGIALAMCLLVAQLWRLQVVRMAEFKEMAESNRIRPERLKSDRGIIYGRGDEVLADNRAAVDIVFVPGECPEPKRAEVCRALERLLGVPADRLLAHVDDHKRDPFTQIDVKQDVSKFERVRVEEFTHRLPGVLTVVRPQRRYIHGSTAGLLLGYLGEINREELEVWDGYHMGDLVGRAGIEREYEPLLKGTDGHMHVTKYASGRPQMRTDRRGVPYIAQRDSKGHILAEFGRFDPEPGLPLRLTLDIALQAKAEALLKGQVGAIVALDADTGAVLALASSPAYDPSIFVTRGHNLERQALLTAPDPNPMLDRTYREQYPPGSVFKVLLASAALEERVIDERTTFFCPGAFRIDGKGRPWHCHKRSGHGHVAVRDALALSCDVFFYNVGLQLGVERIAEWCHRLGLGVPTGIDLPGEVPGLIPTPEWKAALNVDKPVWEQRWYPGETVNLSIGQGSAATTPLQNAVMVASIVNGGYRVRPYLNVELGPQRSERYLSDAALGLVIEGMRKCVEDPNRGTGRRAYIEGIAIIGKTGSAQIMGLKHHEEYATEEDIPLEFRDHAWFVAGVLDHEPRLAICVLVEHGHHGSSAAAPLAKELIAFFYAREAERNAPQEPVTLAQHGGG